jgi:NadR type nicotinamide-nucleotide adenylyltransferase
MGKRIKKGNNSLLKIAIVGPESTGKTTLAKQLAEYYSTAWVSEYAREYVEELKHHYEYSDVEHIAKHQLEQIQSKYPNTSKFVFFDTDLLITKVWFDVVYNKCPEWIIKEIKKKHINLYLLCNTDIPWEPDPVRENGGEARELLYTTYIDELKQYKLPYFEITGTGKTRLESAVKLIDALV